jgi:amino acid transporter
MNDEQELKRLGYEQELARALGAFSNLALSLSIICILAGGVTSFHVGIGSVGGASIGLGWPLACLFSLCVALTMAQLASAFPTAGGLYHWAAILGGRGWGWVTAWFNLAGLVTVLAAINVGTFETAVASFYDMKKLGDWKVLVQTAFVLALSISQAWINHRGIRMTAILTDFSGWWVLGISALLTVLLLACGWQGFAQLFQFKDLGGVPDLDEEGTRPQLWVLFFLGLLLPAYTITGFDASAHAAEETVDASHRVPQGIINSVLLSGVFGWVLLAAAVIAAPSLADAAAQKGGSFVWVVKQALPGWLSPVMLAAIVLAQYLCGLATVTSASRMLYAFARDGGVPFSSTMRHVNPETQVPAAAIWTVALGSVAFTILTPVYDTISAVCVLLLYASYVLPTALGLWAYGRSWTAMGPWSLGWWYRPLAAISVAGCVVLFVIGVQPPNEVALWDCWASSRRWTCCGGAGPGRRSPARRWKGCAWRTATCLLLRRKRNVVNEDELLAVGPVVRGLHLRQRLAVRADEPRPARPAFGPMLARRRLELRREVPGVVV